MNVKLIFLALFLYTGTAFGKEGMWLPFLLEKMNEKDMQGMGMKIKARDIYDINQGSLKDAVVIFGGGCTGEVVSNQGLVITNHHCGYSAVQGLSSVSHDYLSNGFWAKNQQEELPCPGLSVTFIIRIDDVTAQVKNGVLAGMSDSAKTQVRNTNIEKLQKRYKDSTGYDALVKSFFYDNTFYLFMTEKYTDIRLVGFPPNGIGKFGGDTDNWAWPRHTGDFGVFRIYAGKGNKPAPYAVDNKPFVPRRSFTINIGGVKENDFTWVYGFPGRTTEYLSSDGVAEVMNISDPIRIALREARLGIMDEAMRREKSLFIKYAAKQAGIANYYKKWKGELLGLRINEAIDKKKKQEAEFMQWVAATPERKSAYGTLLQDMQSIYNSQKERVKRNEYFNEAIWASDLVKSGSAYKSVLKWIDTCKSLDSLSTQKSTLMGFLQGSDVETDKKITQTLYATYHANIGATSYTDYDYINRMYSSSLLTNEEKIDVLLSLNKKEDILELIALDPAYKAWKYFDSLQTENANALRKNQLLLTACYEKYLQALQLYRSGKAFYPDANSTLRVTYGKVEGVTPADGMKYTFQCTLDGAVQKSNDEVEEFRMPEGLKALYRTKDYGRYAITVNGKPTVPLAFLASNHTTGGNSGSPVLNAKGEMIGTNFDRIWEGTMSDILFDPNLCRNVVLDVRYTLFIIEKFGKAKWIVDEMNIVP